MGRCSSRSKPALLFGAAVLFSSREEPGALSAVQHGLEFKERENPELQLNGVANRAPASYLLSLLNVISADRLLFW